MLLVLLFELCAYFSSLLFSLLPCSTQSLPGPLIVRLSTGTYRGTLHPSTAPFIEEDGSIHPQGRPLVEKWLGIPYAMPPTGNLRFRAPRPLSTELSVAEIEKIRDATSFGAACPQPPYGDNNLGVPMSENCLYLNVFRPTGTEPSANLPVLVYFYGGFYHVGAASLSLYDPTWIIKRSIAISKPIMFVSLNYRLGTFGFLASRFMPSEDLNAGLLDQREALRFIKRNIAAFGGDPSKVTIWGQSAGGGSVEAHILYPDTEGLFRAGIADSSTGPFKSAPYSHQYYEPGMPFRRLSKRLNCTWSPLVIECLRKATYEDLQEASNAMIAERVNGQLWEPAVGPLDSLVPERPSKRVESGNFLKVPYLAGTNLNEGTSLSRAVFNVSLKDPFQEDEAFSSFIRALVMDGRTISNGTLSAIHRLYAANDSSLGGPFHTGDSLFDRAAAWYGDNMYLGPRRFFFQKAVSMGQKLYAYYYQEFVPGMDPNFGVAHGTELRLIFGPVKDFSEFDFANSMRDFYINFVNDLSPGDKWPPYSIDEKEVLQLKSRNITVVPDDWDLHRTEFLNSLGILDEFEK